MKRYKPLFEAEDYRGDHRAPVKDDAPLYDVTLNGIYPEDIYSSHGVQYYGDGQPYDNQTMNIIHAYHNKPNEKIKIYRAVPKVLFLSNEEQIKEYEAQKKYILKTGKIPRSVTNWSDKSEYYDFISDEIDRLKKLPSNQEEKIRINSGDWVAITPQYAKEHGKHSLNNKFRILSKVVSDKDIFTDGNSIHEWGYVK
jgi:hypothetical protein